MRLRNHLTGIISALFIFLFMYTAVSKLQSIEIFKTVLQQSPLLSGIAPVVAWLIPVSELIISVLLLVPAFRSKGLLTSFMLMALFTLYIGYMILFTPHLPCSCGGVLKALSWREHLFFNIFLTGLAALGYSMHQNNNRFIAINRSSRIPV